MPLTDAEKATLRDVQQALAHVERSVDAANIKIKSLIGPDRPGDQNKSGGGS